MRMHPRIANQIGFIAGAFCGAGTSILTIAGMDYFLLGGIIGFRLVEPTLLLFILVWGLLLLAVGFTIEAYVWGRLRKPPPL